MQTKLEDVRAEYLYQKGVGVGGLKRVGEIVEGGEVGAGFVVWVYT